MARNLVYCASASVKLALIDKLNAEVDTKMDTPMPLDMPPNFVSARRKNMVEADLFSRKEPDIFDDFSNQQIQDFHEQNHSGKKWIDEYVFAILDDRSPIDHAVVIWYLHGEFERCHDDVTGTARYKRLSVEPVSWRVRFPDAWVIISQIETGGGLVENVFMQSARFTGEDGIFRVAEAIDAFMAGDLDDSDDEAVEDGAGRDKN